MTVRLYIVTHKISYPSLADVTDDRLRWYVVNEAISGKTIYAPPRSVVHEWDLPAYEPALQANGAREASALFHVLTNADRLLDADYVGFAQYDMEIPSASLDAFESFQARDGADKVGVAFARPWEELVAFAALPPAFWDELLQVFGCAETPAEVPLFSTFVLPKGLLLEMVTRVNELSAMIHAALEFNTSNLAGTLERVFGVWIAAAIAAGRLDPVPLRFAHNQVLRV